MTFNKHYSRQLLPTDFSPTAEPKFYKENEKTRPKLIYNISDTRVRVADEIIPVSAEQSSTKDNDERLYGAALAMDLNMKTYSNTGKTISWIKFNLGQEHCVQKVEMHYESSFSISSRVWTCTQQDCSNCDGSFCSLYTLTVSLEGVSATLPADSDCRNGNMVKLDKAENVFNNFNPVKLYVNEMVIIRKKGKAGS